mmetsp:Transcript_14512/g.41346  ORF Transcript_14512/g.41346 Transcript_14512/m.41346 type:complete len:244 (+) Transcript_14512:83-814(+)
MATSFGTSTLSTAPKFSFISPAMTPAISSSSSMGTFFMCGSKAKWPPSPIVPPRKIFAPATAFILPSSFLRFAGAPMRPMSAAWTWPQEFGQPVQWTRTGFGASTSASTFAMTRSATVFVSIIAKGQNCAPVHETMGPLTFPGSTANRPIVKAGSCSKASMLSAGTFGNIKFCSTVSRTSPSLYRSARSATCLASSTLNLPAGTCTPTLLKPSSACACTPSNSRLSKAPVSWGCASSRTTPRP